MIEQPIGYRVTWDSFPAMIRLGRRAMPASRDFVSRGEAETEKLQLIARFGDGLVVCVTPIYVTRAARTRRYASQQANAAAEWPLQSRTTTT